MNFLDIPHFRECFTGIPMNDANMARYLGIVADRSSPSPSAERPEKHHIVPREWLKFNVPGFGFGSEDPRNVVYLSVVDKISAMQLAIVMFLDLKDSRTYSSLVASMSRRYHLNRAELWRNPFIGDLRRLAARRKSEILNKKRKYDDEYLKECMSMLKTGDDEMKSFQNVVAKMGYAHSAASLKGMIERRFGRTSAEEPNGNGV